MMEPTEIIKENRKTIAIQIKRTGEIVVRAPYAVSLMEIQRFFESKKDWIAEKVNKISSLNNTYKDYINYNNFLFFGIYTTNKTIEPKNFCQCIFFIPHSPALPH